VAFNAEATISDTLYSVATQTHPQVEHILIDGASRDQTMAVVQKHGGHLARSVSERDNGIYDAMNKGLALATGDIIGFLNADDFYTDTGVLANVAAVMVAEKLDVLYGDVTLVAQSDLTRVVRRYCSQRFDPQRMGHGWMPAHPALFIRKHVFDTFGGFRTDFRIAGDFELVARIFKSHTLRYRHLPRELVRMRTGGISTSGWRGTLLLNQEVLRACRENGIETNWIKLLSKYPAKLKEINWVRRP
jgi:glycosyltransferase involved in cell wall biosynthesis